jgi:hypothetical protein
MKMVLVILAAMVVAGVVLLVLRARRTHMKHGEILPADEMRQRYDLTAAKRPTLRIDLAHVPEELRDLISMAEKWGIPDDIIRGDFQEEATPDEKEALRVKLAGRTKEVSAWLDSFGADQPMSEEAGHFMYMLLGLDEMGLWTD